MMILGVQVHIWLVMTLYFVTILPIGWWSRRRARNSEGYLVGNRRFGVFMMILHAFGAGTNPGDAAGVISRTVSNWGFRYLSLLAMAVRHAVLPADCPNHSPHATPDDGRFL